jgi:hypothetical protein
VFTGQVSTTAGAWVTVKLAAQVLVSHVLVTVNVTVRVPPAHRRGAVPPLLVTEPRLQPPLADTEPSQLLYALFISVCEQDVTVVFCGHVIVTADGADTVNDEVHDCVPQKLVTVHVTEVVPPHIPGATGFVGFLVGDPPPLLTELSQFVNAVFISVAEQDAMVVF